MYNFPIPYLNELIYSTVARAGVYHGITSSKQLLDEVFNNRKVIATLDLPCHLQPLAEHLKKTGSFSVEYLIYKHTMFPLYAPFVTESHRVRAIQLMAGRSQGAVHLSLGVAASRIRNDARLRYCPSCLKNQLAQYGENFWQRNWFFPGLNVCPLHGTLNTLPLNTTGQRHQFHALNIKLEQPLNTESCNPDLLYLSQYANKLLELEPGESPSFAQWTAFYRDIASDFGLCRGSHIKHDEVNELVRNTFQLKILDQLHLHINSSVDTCWLKSIFRKHRKAFSYLEHGVVWKTFFPSVPPVQLIERVRNIRPNTKTFCYDAKVQVTNRRELQLKRQLWKKVVLELGVTGARKVAAGKALYAWCYRNDRAWFFHFNAEHQKRPLHSKPVVDWHKRDLRVVRRLFRVLQVSERSFNGPRLSINYMLSQLDNKSTVEKNLDKLPLVKRFLNRYTENITEYQLRRLCHACIDSYRETDQLKSWVVFRKAGLSKERLTPGSRQVLAELRLF